MRYILEISSKAMPGRDDDFVQWYDNTHMPEVLAVPGFLSCERFVREQADGSGKRDYVALYEIESDDPHATLQALFAAAPGMQMTDAIDPQSARFEILIPAGNGVVQTAN